MTISAPTVIIGMLNGMLGGVILVLPLLSLDGGTVVTFFVILISGIFSYYSCQLCVKHLGKYSDLDQAILNHFDHSKFMKIFYDIIVFLNLSFLLILYFELIVEQWQGMFQYSIANPLANCVVLFILVFVMKYFDFGASLLAYGIISIIGYIIFLGLLLASSPEGEKKMDRVGTGAVAMAASMGQAFAIQTFFIPILRKNQNQQNYQLYTLLAYIIGIIAYMYIAYAGAFGILQRQPVKQHPQTIQEYFNRGYWQLYSLQIIYLIHLYSVFPQFLLISKKRLFNAFGIEGARKGQIPFKQIIYSIALIGICLGISLSQVQIDDIIELNGAVIGFFFIYFLPLIMHIKCLYFSGKKQNEQIKIQIVPLGRSQQSLSGLEEKQKSQPRQSLLTHRTSLGDIISDSKNSQSSASVPPPPQKLVCYAVKPSLVYQIFDIAMLVGMMIVGGFIMFDGIKSVFFNRN